MANKIFNSAVFSGPKFSYFDMSHPNNVSMKFGDIVPIYWDYLNPNDKATFDMSQVVRLSPMLQPVLSQMDITVDAYAVRLRSLGMAERDPWKYEDFFNANKNLDGSYMLPRCSALDALDASAARLGSLYDYLGYPTMDGFRKELRRQLAAYPYLLSSALGVYEVETSSGADSIVTEFIGALGACPKFVPLLGSLPHDNIVSNDGEFAKRYWNYDGFTFSTKYFNNTVASIIPLSVYALVKLIAYQDNESISDNVAGYFEDLTEWCSSGVPSDIVQALRVKSLPEYFYEIFQVDWQSVTEEWFQFVFEEYVLHGYQVSGGVLTSVNMRHYFEDLLKDNVGTVSNMSSPAGTAGEADDSSIVPITPGGYSYYQQAGAGLIQTPLYPALSYWKIISDWYLNTGLFEPDEFFLQKAFVNGDTTAGYNLSVLFGEPFKRNWSPDYFTTAFDSAQRGLAVGIPADGTIPDLRNANALQKFKERLLFAGHKFRDVIYSIFGIKMSSAIADMSEVLGRWVNPVNIDSTLQTSASTPDSPLANYAGSGLAYGHKKHLLHYVAEEPTLIMFVASVRPKYATYYQGFPKKLRRNYLMDYAMPGFSSIGEQMISNRELYCDFGAGDSEVFGYTRRFADFMFAPGEVHGDFKDSLDSWHLARQFDSAPLLNQQFLQVDAEADNLNRIFATTSDSLDKFYCNFFISGGIVRSIPKRIYYDL